ncbi:MAG: hypothetical protein NTY77_15100 [Elusimicrobia bacterium]|nr:hypothetical protein [Elusimicrobiota bacterium]
MYILVTHQIKDAKAFFEKGSSLVKKVPQGLTPHLFLPDKKMSSAICVWEADSVDRLQNYMDKELGLCSVNECTEIDAAKAMGLELLASAPAV